MGSRPYTAGKRTLAGNVSAAAKARGHRVISNRKLLFLIDGLGGIATASMMGLVLPRFQAWIGLPARVLHLLAIVGLFCAAFSLLHASGVLRHSSGRLKFIAVRVKGVVYPDS